MNITKATYSSGVYTVWLIEAGTRKFTAHVTRHYRNATPGRLGGRRITYRIHVVERPDFDSGGLTVGYFDASSTPLRKIRDFIKGLVSA